MQVEWYGHSAFRLSTEGLTVVVDPFGDVSSLAARGVQFDYPALPSVSADVVLVTHEHTDHNGVEAISGSPFVVRATAGRVQSPVGEIVAIASEHDSVAGTQRGPNTIFCFELDGLRVCHFGDFGQPGLRAEQAAAIGSVDLLFIPVGGGPTINAIQADAIVRELSPPLVVPMHYRTVHVNFLEPADAFLERMPATRLLERPRFETSELEPGHGPLAVVPAAP